ncbi:hypothetical protein HA62_06655 [Pseudomonas putida]|nr:hypothetical protein HA62_06655 [Pseudomonas putida]
MKAWIGAVALAGTLASGQVMAAAGAADTGNDMIVGCAEFLKETTSPASYFPAGVCAGFVAGVTNTLTYARLSSPTTVPICIPTGFTIGQGARVFLKYLYDHPQSLHIEATALAITAYREAYPCSK